MYKRNIEVRSRNHFCRGEAITITYSESVSVALATKMQSACDLLYFRLWPVWIYHIFPYYLTKGTILGGEKLWNINFVF